jgi:hypothetical protein
MLGLRRVNRAPLRSASVSLILDRLGLRVKEIGFKKCPISWRICLCINEWSARARRCDRKQAPKGNSATAHELRPARRSKQEDGIQVDI